MTGRQSAADNSREQPHRHILTVAVEDYFQGKAFAGVIDRRQWSRFETRVERNTLAALDLLERHEVSATFFFMSWIAENHPDLLREVVRRGHEIASSGMSKLGFRDSSRADFARDVVRSREILESVAGVKVRGYGVADHRLKSRDLWALEVLAENGYEYDSSINPSLLSFRSEPWRRFVHREHFGGQSLWEIPLSSLNVGGIQVPVAGGNWFRQLPEQLIRHAVQHWTTSYTDPFVMYFRVWDLDPDQPIITGAPRLSRLRHYRNPDKLPRLIEHFLTEYKFSSIGNYLGLDCELSLRNSTVAAHFADVRVAAPRTTPRTAVTVVIPCYNEESALPYLANTLRDLRDAAGQFELRFLFVDDGSTDSTANMLEALFGSWEHCEIVSHGVNRGVAASILTGIRHAATEIVCSMDCDCTYDPHELSSMIPMLTPGVDLVTASPYHPLGHVLRVPSWRLALSKTASALYRIVLRQPLYTYTSCFRVYRKSAVTPIELREGGFLGVAEMIARLDLAGSRIAEYPTTLQVRMLGHSKMRVLKTIGGHIRLMARFGLERLFGRTEPLKRGPAEFSSTLYASKGIDRE